MVDVLNFLFVYVCFILKDYGLENFIEGEFCLGMKVVVVEDLIFIGGSSLKVVEVICWDGCEVIGMVVVYIYGFFVVE